MELENHDIWTQTYDVSFQEDLLYKNSFQKKGFLDICYMDYEIHNENKFINAISKTERMVVNYVEKHFRFGNNDLYVPIRHISHVFGLTHIKTFIYLESYYVLEKNEKVHFYDYIILDSDRILHMRYKFVMTTEQLWEGGIYWGIKTQVTGVKDFYLKKEAKTRSDLELDM